jgi:drug/metabolite transporter (DMT)-like permease
MLSSRERLGFALGFVGIAAFAGSLPATRIAVTEFDPWFVTALRACIAGAAASVLLLALRRPIPPRETWMPLAVVAAGVVLGFPILTGIAMQTVPASHGAVVIGILPLATAVAAALIAHERLSVVFWISSVVGASIVVTFALRRSGGFRIESGDILMLAAVVTVAIGYTVSGKLARKMPGWEVISWACIGTLPIFAVLTFWLWPANIAATSAPVWAAMAYVGLVSQFLGFFAWNAGLAMGGIARVGQIQLLQPFITIAIAATFNNEPIELSTIVFAAAVVATVLIGQRARRVSPPAASVQNR